MLVHAVVIADPILIFEILLRETTLPANRVREKIYRQNDGRYMAAQLKLN
jgi:hypothetical protein